MEMLMLKKLDNYFDSFDPKIQEGVRQALEYFKCCDETLELLNDLKAEDLELQRVAAEDSAKEDTERSAAWRAVAKGKKIKIEEPQKITTVVGLCPRCSTTLVGTMIPSCEKEHSDRVFYKECTACSYYSEIFKKRNKHYEVEGG
jgi:formate dehydrogenase maturation protein FdhE